LLELPEKPYGGSRSYDEQGLQRLRFIRRAQELGFSLDDIRELLELSSSDCERVEELAAQKLTEVKAKLRQLRRIEWILAKTVEQCGRRKSNQPCPIINIASIYQVFIKQAIRPQGEQRPFKALVLGSSPSQPSLYFLGRFPLASVSQSGSASNRDYAKGGEKGTLIEALPVYVITLV
jgi:MerR family transcriptional regulator, mercuric resistance operon regulatory protein